MTNEMAKQAPAKGSSRGAMIGAYLVAGVLGYVCGARGFLTFGPFRPSSTPLARLGYVLQQDNPEAGSAAGPELGDDVETIRRSWTGQERDVLDLVVAARGLTRNGESDWDRAEQLCRGLNWPRCDRPALEELKRRSRP